MRLDELMTNRYPRDTDREELLSIVKQLKEDSGIEFIGVRLGVAADISVVAPGAPQSANGAYLPDFQGERHIFIETPLFDGPRVDLLHAVYHEVAHAMTENIYGPHNAHLENFQDTLEDLVEAGFAAGRLTQSDLDAFELKEAGYNPDDIDRSDFILNDESDAAQELAASIIANNIIWLEENNPHEVGTLRDERWEAIQKGEDTSEIEGEMLLDAVLNEFFNHLSGGDDEITLDEMITTIRDEEDAFRVETGNEPSTSQSDDEIIEEFDITDADSNRIIDYDEFVFVVEDEFSDMTVAQEDIAPYLLDLDLDGEVQIDDMISILRDIVGLEELSDAEFVLADANRDGVVDISDAIAGLRLIVGLTTIESIVEDAFVPALDFA